MSPEYWITRWSLSSGGAYAPTRWRVMTAGDVDASMPREVRLPCHPFVVTLAR
jgi:hypothetical protein